MKLEDYMRSKENPPPLDRDIMKSLSETERFLVKTLQRVEIRGKRGRMVPVILTESLQATIEILVKLRNDEEVNVSEDNEYLFPAPHSQGGHFRADVVLRKLANECGVTDPKSLTATRLRKHVATTVQLLNLRENELDALAGYMGHDINVHRNFYRLPSDTMQLAKVSKVLLNMESGKIDRMKGLNLDEVEVGDLLDDVEDELPDDIDDPIGLPDDILGDGMSSHNECSSGPSSGRPPATKKTGVKRSAQTQGRKQHGKRQKFSQEHTDMIMAYFAKLIKNKITPQKADVEKFKEAYPEMAEVEWSRIKFKVYNTFAEK